MAPESLLVSLGSAARSENAFGKQDRIGVRDVRVSMLPRCSGDEGSEIVAQQEYEQSRTIDAPPEEVFAWLSDVGNLPKYLPPVVNSSVEGPAAEGVPARTGAPSMPKAIWRWTRKSAGWSGARRRGATTRGG
jgi:hypothetical protein